VAPHRPFGVHPAGHFGHVIFHVAHRWVPSTGTHYSRSQCSGTVYGKCSSSFFFFILFCACLLISLFRNGSTTSSCTRRLFTTFRTGSTNSDNGTWTCSLSLPKLNRRASTWVATGSYSLMRSSIDLTPTFWFRSTPSSCLCLLICGISSANSRPPSSTGIRTPPNLKSKPPVPRQCRLIKLARRLVVFPLVSLSFSNCLFIVWVLTSFSFYLFSLCCNS